MHIFEVHSNESVCRKIGRIGLEQVLIIVSLIMVMLNLTLQIFQMNIALNLFQIQTPLQSNQLMIIKWTISGMLPLRTWWWSSGCWPLYASGLIGGHPPSNFFTVSTLLFHKYVGANVAVTNFKSHFLYLSQPRPLWNWPIETRDMPKGLEFFYVVFLTVVLYIQWCQFIIVQVALTTLSHQVPSNYMLVFKRLHINLLNVFSLLTLKVVLGYHTTILKKI